MPTARLPAVRVTRAALGCALVLIAIPALAQQPPASPPSVTVQGEASADVAPDSVNLSVGVTVERPTASEAMAAVAKAAQSVVVQIKAEGIADNDVTTTGIGLAPVDPNEGVVPPARPKLLMFRASTTVLLRVKPADKAGTVASHLVDKGVNTIDSFTYESSRRADVLDGLRGDAMRDARRKAEIYVAALGLRLGPVLDIQPVGEAMPPSPMPMARFEKGVATIPVQAGTIALGAAVNVRWAIAP